MLKEVLRSHQLIVLMVLTYTILFGLEGFAEITDRFTSLRFTKKPLS